MKFQDLSSISLKAQAKLDKCESDESDEADTMIVELLLGEAEHGREMRKRVVRMIIIFMMFSVPFHQANVAGHLLP